jgi:hypothetical protein
VEEKLSGEQREQPSRDIQKEVLQLEPMAKRFAREIGKAANTKWRNGAQMAAAVAARTLQNVVTSVILSGHKAGDSEGEALIKRFYLAALDDATKYWRGPQVQTYFKVKRD